MAVTARAALVAVVMVALVGPRPAAAQPVQPHPLDREIAARTVSIGPGQFMFESIFAALRAVSVPVGFEAADAFAESRIEAQHWPGASRELKVEGLTVRALLDAVVAADPRYEWQYVGAVVVIRPAGAWSDPRHPLLRSVPAVKLERVAAHEFLGAVNLATGHPASNGGPSTTRTLSMTFGGGRLIDLLNALVETHGEMGWSLHSSATPSDDRRTLAMGPKLFLHSPVGGGVAIDGALLEPEQPVPAVVKIKGTPLVYDGLAHGRDILDVPLPEGVGQLHAKGLTRLAMALGIPSGFEEAGALSESVSNPFRLRGDASLPEWSLPDGSRASVEGLTLRQALEAVVAADRRYGWRVIDGVVVIRPIESWGRGDHPLAAEAPPVSLRDARVSEAFDVLRSAVDPSVKGPTPPFGDEDRLSVDFPGGSLLDLVTAIVRGHGHLSWSLVASEDVVGLADSTLVRTLEPLLSLEAQFGSAGISLSRPSEPPAPSPRPSRRKR